ncbi:MAG: Asd/ArgC dimerization domain-containing protein [Moraxellaceae bacterium]|nr:Asd/ArgC dimerization domain-containing protein [Moraxellaceae bacterium]
MGKGCRLVIVGVTGEVGRGLLSRLEDKEQLALSEVHVLSSAADEDDTVMYRQRPLIVESADGFDFSRADIAILATPAEASRMLARRALDAGCRVMDLSSAFRGASGVPQIISAEAEAAELVSGLSGEAALLLPLIKAVREQSSLRAMQVTLLQPVSSAGRAGVRELAGQTGELLNGRGIEPAVFARQVAFNCLPLVGSSAVGMEAAIVAELEEALGEDLPIVLQRVVIPVFYGLTALVSMETDSPVSLAEAASALASADGVTLVNIDENQQVATPVTDASGQSGIYVCGLRELPEGQSGLAFTALADNVHQGAAEPALQLLEKWIKDFKY